MKLFIKKMFSSIILYIRWGHIYAFVFCNNNLYRCLAYKTAGANDLAYLS